MLPELVTTDVTNDDRGVWFLRVEIIHKLVQEREGIGVSNLKDEILHKLMVEVR